MIESEIPHIIVSELSHPGEKRTHNEDRYAIKNYRTAGDDKPAVLAIVADGIGGHLAGEVAAQITTDTILNKLTPAEIKDPVQQLKEAIVEASRAVSQEAQETPERQGMGSTVAVAWILGSRLYTASAGDSRIYLAREDRIRQISIDHTWIQEALDYNIITPEEAENHPQAHVLRRYIGGREIHEPDTRLRLEAGEDDARSEANQGLRLRIGDQIFLCSDGLTDLVTDPEIFETLQKRPPTEAVTTLVDLARARGGHDNITVVLLTIPKLPRPIQVRRKIPWVTATLAGMIGLICLVTLVLAISWWFGIWPWSSRAGDVIASPTVERILPTSTGVMQDLTLPTTSATFVQLPTPTRTQTPSDTATPFPLPTVGPSSTSTP